MLIQKPNTAPQLKDEEGRSRIWQGGRVELESVVNLPVGNFIESFSQHGYNFLKNHYVLLSPALHFFPYLGKCVQQLPLSTL